MKAACLIVGVGNPDRGDDAVGRLIAASLRDRVPSGVAVREDNGEMTTLLEWLEGTEKAYLVDAAASGARAGTTHRFAAHEAPLPKTLLALSTHGFGVAEAIELARAMGTLPPVCVVFAVEGEDFEAGRPVSAVVAAAVDGVVERILAEIGG